VPKVGDSGTLIPVACLVPRVEIVERYIVNPYLAFMEDCVKLQVNCVVPVQVELPQLNPEATTYESTEEPFKVVGASQVRVKLVLDVATPAKFDGALAGDKVFDELELVGE
jgi:hypothetical protein